MSKIEIIFNLFLNRQNLLLHTICHLWQLARLISNRQCLHIAKIFEFNKNFIFLPFLNAKFAFTVIIAMSIECRLKSCKLFFGTVSTFRFSQQNLSVLQFAFVSPLIMPHRILLSFDLTTHSSFFAQ